MLSAVVSPTPPGQTPGSVEALIVANTVRLPLGVSSTIVEPVPWLFDFALKFETSRSPAWSEPAELVTAASPYGFTSPLDGTVEPTVLTCLNCARNGVVAVGVAAVVAWAGAVVAAAAACVELLLL